MSLPISLATHIHEVVGVGEEEQSVCDTLLVAQMLLVSCGNC